MNFLMSLAMGRGGKGPLQRDVCSRWSVGLDMGRTICKQSYTPVSPGDLKMLRMGRGNIGSK